MDSHPEVPLAITSAGNAPQSVTFSNFQRDMEVNPHKELNFWKRFMFNQFDLYRRTPRSDIALCDVGCGSGEITKTMAHYAQSLGLQTHVAVIDMMPGNVYQTKKNLHEIGIQNAQYMIGDVNKQFPTGTFDFITAFEVIHFMTPPQIDGLVKHVRSHLHTGGWFVISYATELNNALLRDQQGHLDLSRGFGERPIHRWSYETQSWMTFPDKKWLMEIGKIHSLRPYYYLETDNPYFPTRRELRIPLMSSYRASTENAYMAFRAVDGESPNLL